MFCQYKLIASNSPGIQLLGQAVHANALGWGLAVLASPLTACVPGAIGWIKAKQTAAIEVRFDIFNCCVLGNWARLN